jgi:hypothetical protein
MFKLTFKAVKVELDLWALAVAIQAIIGWISS